MKKILFITDNNIATSMLVEGTLNAARTFCLPLEIEVVSISEGVEILRNNPPKLTLLSPSMRFFLNDQESKGLPEDAKIVVVDSNVYGALNGKAVFDIITKNS